MTDQTKRAVAIFLIVAALIVGAVAAALWQKADSDAEPNPYNSAFGLQDPPAADHTPSIVLLGIGGVMLISGVILVSSAKPVKREPVAAREEDAGWG